MRIETLAVHAGHSVDPSTGAVTPPIQLSTTFERSEDGSYPQGHFYSRTSNPNREALEQCLSSLEGGMATAAFASGSAATMSIFQSLSPQDHVLAPKDAYHGTAKLLREIFIPWGLAVTFVDMTDLEQVKAALQPNTKLIWTETPSNPLLKITDIAEVANLAHHIGARCVCDNTWATPVLQRPLEQGADLVLHATTKYLGGHSDVLGGAVVSKVEDSFFQKIRAIQQSGGAVPSPFDCWLTLRGIRTLPYRMRAHSENALNIAQFLERHDAIENVYYPGLKQHPGHDLATQQMKLFGGMLSFQVAGGQKRAMEVCRKVKLFTRATSLGGTESLIEHRASMEGPRTQTPNNLLRASIGLEHIDDLLEDLKQAL
jgi:cystathionine gamma-synthase